MKNLDLISEELFNKIRGRFPTVTIGNEEGIVTNNPKEARFYDFDYKEGPKSLGKISISVDESNLSVMYSNNFVEGQDEVTKNKWYDFLKELRFFAKKRLLNFDTRDITKSNLNKRDYKFLAKDSGEEKMTESKMYGTSKTSYQDVGTARLAIKHNKAVNQELASGRTQHVDAIYIESAEGERFKYPFKHLNGARAMARHVSEGGKTHDDFGNHITGLSEELYKLKKFKSYMNRSGVMAEGLAQYMDIVNERVLTVKKTIEGLQKEKAYKEAIENYAVKEVKEVPEDVASNWIDQLTIKQFNEELKDVFPYIYNLVNETNQVQELSPEHFNEDDAYFDYSKMAKDIHTRYGETISMSDIEEWVDDHVDDPHMIDMDELAEAIEDLGVDIHHSDDYEGQPSSYDEYQDLYGGDDWDHGQFDSFESWADNTVDSALDEAPFPGEFDYTNSPQEDEEIKAIMMKHPEEAKKLKATGDLDSGSDLYMDLFRYYSESGDMPYGTQKARDGDPVEWIMDRLDDLGMPMGNLADPMGNLADIDQAWPKISQLKMKLHDQGMEPEDAQDAAAEKLGYDPEMVDQYLKYKFGESSELDEGYMKGYKKYHCKDCQDTMHMPTTNCPHDSHDESGSWWRDENGNGVPDMIEGVKTEEKQMPITEFVLSMYDRHTGQFPKGETAILTAIEKDYGEQYITPAKKFIEAINAKYEQMMTQEPESNTELDSILQLSGQKY
mgnify:CR=1 FL=1